MIRNVIFIALSLMVMILSYLIQSFEFILIGFIGLSIIFLVLAGLIHIFSKVNPKILRIPLFIIGICALGIVASLFRPYDEAILKTGNESEKLEYAYETDQKDRMQLKPYILNDLHERDEIRLKQVRNIYNSAEELEPIDKFHAAFVYHHSDNSNDYEIASSLAAAAAKAPHLKDHYQVQWLSKAAYDRWMLSIGKPEKYNTQNKFSIGVE
ncbi:sulfite exporter TauE/SafE family protein [Salinimicrobium sp. GXAS 041]|uniref:sulfite exporter TauE/SafE family protein n=1 Tax=Salinimicrobium sp. GXAS 041 TaxID=3400806 RepID=UPI003C77486D